MVLQNPDSPDFCFFLALRLEFSKVIFHPFHYHGDSFHGGSCLVKTEQKVEFMQTYTEFMEDYAICLEENGDFLCWSTFNRPASVLISAIVFNAFKNPKNK